MTGRRSRTTLEPLAGRTGKQGDLAGTLWETSRHTPAPAAEPRIVDGWGSLSRPWPVEGFLGARLGAPGLWRRVPSVGQGGGHVGGQALFELPADVVDAAERDGAGRRSLLAWAEASAAGALPDGWIAPTDDELSLPAAGSPQLTVRAGSQVVQGQLLHDEQRLAVRYGLGSAPTDPARRAWFDAHIADAAASWRLVRVGIDADADNELVAEVDLSGAPAAVLQPLLAVALTSLRWWVGWSLPGVALLGDNNLSSAVLDRPTVFFSLQTS